MKEHYYGFVELTSEELTDIRGGEKLDEDPCRLVRWIS